MQTKLFTYTTPLAIRTIGCRVIDGMTDHNQLTKSQQEVHVDLPSKGCTALF